MRLVFELSAARLAGTSMNGVVDNGLIIYGQNNNHVLRGD